MRIQQQLHSSPWNIRAISELPIVLKSSGTENRPRRNPSLRTCFPVGVSRAVTLTIAHATLANRSGGNMLYAEFRDQLEDALQEAGLFFHGGDSPVETIDLADTA